MSVADELKFIDFHELVTKDKISKRLRTIIETGDTTTVVFLRQKTNSLSGAYLTVFKKEDGFFLNVPNDVVSKFLSFNDTVNYLFELVNEGKDVKTKKVRL